MNCDQVFDILTRGPFPTGQASDKAVESHLNRCPECRRLAAALQPAVEFLQESIPVEESYDLPGYWGELFERNADQVACQTPTRIAGMTLPPRLTHRVNELRNAPWGHAVRVAAVILIGVGLALSFGRLTEPDSARPTQLAEQSAKPSIGALREKETALPAKAFNFASLAAACREPIAIEPPVHHSSDDSDASGHDTPSPRRTEALKNEAIASQHCCTRCHNAAADQTVVVSVAARSSYLRSCATCHVPGDTGSNAAIEAGISG